MWKDKKPRTEPTLTHYHHHFAFHERWDRATNPTIFRRPTKTHKTLTVRIFLTSPLTYSPHLQRGSEAALPLHLANLIPGPLRTAAPAFLFCKVPSTRFSARGDDRQALGRASVRAGHRPPRATSQIGLGT